MGFFESIEKVPDADRACTRAAKSTFRLTKKPGVSPLLFGSS